MLPKMWQNTVNPVPNISKLCPVSLITLLVINVLFQRIAIDIVGPETILLRSVKEGMWQKL